MEDVITTGKSALECGEIVKENYSIIAGYACIIDRTNKESIIKDNIISQIKLKIETYKNNELPEDLKKIQQYLKDNPEKAIDETIQYILGIRRISSTTEITHHFMSDLDPEIFEKLNAKAKKDNKSIKQLAKEVFSRRFSGRIEPTFDLNDKTTFFNS